MFLQFIVHEGKPNNFFIYFSSLFQMILFQVLDFSYDLSHSNVLLFLWVLKYLFNVSYFEGNALESLSYSLDRICETRHHKIFLEIVYTLLKTAKLSDTTFKKLSYSLVTLFWCVENDILLPDRNISIFAWGHSFFSAFVLFDCLGLFSLLLRYHFWRLFCKLDIMLLFASVNKFFRFLLLFFHF